MTPEIYTTLTDLPTTIYSFVRQNHDGSYTVVINARLSCEDRAKHYEHELRHIIDHDFEKEETADEIEAYAHREDT